MKSLLSLVSVLPAACVIFSSFAMAAPREWTDQTGRKITAEYVFSEGDQVTLSINGKEYKMPVAKLSAADQAYLKIIASPPGEPAAPAQEPSKVAAPKSSVAGPIETEGSNYYYYVPSSLKAGRKAPLLFYTGSGGGSATTVKAMVEGAEICSWIVACSVESKNSSDESKNPVHSEHCVSHLLETQAIDGKLLYFSGNSGGARIAFINGKALKGAGVLALIAGAGDGELSKSNHYFIVSGATDYNRYETAETFSSVRKSSAYRMHPEGHANGPEWLMTEGMVWLQAKWNIDAAQMTPERADFEGAVIQWIETMKIKSPYRAAWWADFFNTGGVSPQHQSKIAALDAELSKDPSNTAYIKGISDIEELAVSVLSKVSKYSEMGHTTPEIQKKADKMLQEHPTTPWISEIATALKNPTAGTKK